MITPHGQRFYRTKREPKETTELLAKETSQQLPMHDEKKIVLECAIPNVIYFHPFPAGESARRHLGGEAWTCTVRLGERLGKQYMQT